MLNQFLRFLVIGGIGFVVDGGLLYLLVKLGYAPELCRLITFPVAVTVTWQLNRVWTFQKPSGPSKASKTYPGYLLVQTIGALLNFAVFLVILQFVTSTAEGAFAAFSIGSAVGLLFNFFALRRLVFSEV
tara:strand:+ start:3279 stop:3668 length:390 start_codon:yes stop_codon:yes gene_type:complete